MALASSEQLSAKDMEKEAHFSKLMTADKASDNCINELRMKISELNQKLAEEKSVNGQLQEILCSVQGRIAVHYQRSEELGIQNFRKMMYRAKDELNRVKCESDDLSRELLSASASMLDDINVNSARFENIRIEFKNVFTMNRCSDMDSNQIERFKKQLEHLESKIKSVKISKDNVSQALMGLDNTDSLLKYFIGETETAEESISELTKIKQQQSAGTSF